MTSHRTQVSVPRKEHRRQRQIRFSECTLNIATDFMFNAQTKTKNDFVEDESKLNDIDIHTLHLELERHEVDQRGFLCRKYIRYFNDIGLENDA